MNKTAYDTLLLKGFKMEKVESQVRQAIIRGELSLLEETERGKVYGVTDKVDIDPFNYPLYFEMDGRGTITAIDLRTHLRGVRLEENRPVLLPGSTAEQLFHTAKLQQVWNTDNYKLRQFSPLPLVLYSNWTAEAITRKLGLDPASQIYLTVVFGYFYFSRFVGADLPTLERQKFVIQLSRHLKYDTTLVEDLTKRIGEATFEDLHGLVNFIKQDNFNIRLDKLQLKDVYAVLNIGWFGGPNAREQVDVALEFPPLFISMVHQAVTNRSYNKTPLSQLYQRYSRSFPMEEFKRDFLIITRG